MVNSILKYELILLHKCLSENIIFYSVLSQRKLACSRFGTWTIIRIKEVVSILKFIKVITSSRNPKCHFRHIVNSVFVTCTKPIVKNLRQKVFTKWYSSALERKIIVIKIIKKRINFGRCFIR